MAKITCSRDAQWATCKPYTQRPIIRIYTHTHTHTQMCLTMGLICLITKQPTSSPIETSKKNGGQGNIIDLYYIIYIYIYLIEKHEPYT